MTDGDAPGRRRATIVLPAAEPGGAERVLLSVARTLARRPGWQVEVLVLAAGTGDFLKTAGEGVAISTGTGSGAAGREWRLAHRLAGRRHDLVVSSHIRMNAALSVLRRLGRLACGRLVSRESTILADRAKGPRMALYRALYRSYGAQDLLIAQTDDMAERVRPLLPGPARARLATLANPVDVAAIRAGAEAPLPEGFAPANGPLIVWCGRMIALKRPDLAVTVLAQLHRGGRRDARLLMIGDGPERAAAEALARAQGVGQSVHFAGALANPFALMRLGAAGLVTSEREGFPNVLLEMMACGVPAVVATPCVRGLAVEGVCVAEPSALAGTLARALAGERLCSAEGIERTLVARGVEGFADALLGLPLVPVLADKAGLPVAASRLASARGGVL